MSTAILKLRINVMNILIIRLVTFERMEQFLTLKMISSPHCAVSNSNVCEAHEGSHDECILVPRGRAPFGQYQESRPLAKSNTGSPRFTDFPSLCACSESSLTNLIGSGLNLLCLQSHSETECRWTRPEVAILGADQTERSLWGRE